MKTKRRIIVFATGILFFSIIGCKNASSQEKPSEETKIKNMLRMFYTNYVKMNAGGVNNNTDSLLNLYCTKELIVYVNNAYSEPPGKINSDIFVLTQMVVVRMVDNM